MAKTSQDARGYGKRAGTQIRQNEIAALQHWYGEQSDGEVNMSSISTDTPGAATEKRGNLVRALSWKGAFWIAAGVPPLVLFSIGGIAGTTGKLAFVVWMVSMLMGFLQSFTYAEMAGMFGNKSGGTSVYGATA